jgi:hypothetical protein
MKAKIRYFEFGDDRSIHWSMRCLRRLTFFGVFTFLRTGTGSLQTKQRVKSMHPPSSLMSKVSTHSSAALMCGVLFLIYPRRENQIII